MTRHFFSFVACPNQDSLATLPIHQIFTKNWTSFKSSQVTEGERLHYFRFCTPYSNCLTNIGESESCSTAAVFHVLGHRHRVSPIKRTLLTRRRRRLCWFVRTSIDRSIGRLFVHEEINHKRSLRRDKG